MTEISIWQRVAFSATFLRSIGWQDAGNKCGMRGDVIEVKDDPLLLIDWGTHTGYVNKHNLIAVNTPGGLQADVEKSQVYGYNEKYKRYDV